jgi:drug/metabolite transporter, DME family
MSRRYGAFQVLAAATLWGTTGPVQVLARLPVAPAAVGGVRILTGGLVLLAWALARRAMGRLAMGRQAAGRLATGRRGDGPLASAFPGRRQWRPLLAASCATGVFQAAYFTSVSRTGAALATAIVFGVAPVATGLAARVTDRSPLGWGWAASTACAVTGCVLLLRPGPGSRADGLGVILAIVAAACYAVYTVSAKRLAEDGAPMATAVSVTLITGGLMLAPWLVTAGPGLLGGRALLTAAWLGPVTTAAAYMLFVQGLRTIPAAAAGTLSLAEPLVAAVLGIGLLHEHLTAPAVIGCGLLAAGLAFASLRTSPGSRRPDAVAGSAPDVAAAARRFPRSGPGGRLQAAAVPRAAARRPAAR